jgi:two-component system, NtrC family, nitrogen regulation response regulator NtrX
MAKILLVDDDTATLLALADTLRLKLPNVHVDTSQTPGAALERLHHRQYDLIITDWRMPRMNGLALLREARRLRPTMPFVLITGHGDGTDYLHLAQAAGAFEVLLKPLDRQRLIETVRRGLNPPVRRQASIPSSTESSAGAI